MCGRPGENIMSVAVALNVEWETALPVGKGDTVLSDEFTICDAIFKLELSNEANLCTFKISLILANGKDLQKNRFEALTSLQVSNSGKFSGLSASKEVEIDINKKTQELFCYTKTEVINSVKVYRPNTKFQVIVSFRGFKSPVQIHYRGAEISLQCDVEGSRSQRDERPHTSAKTDEVSIVDRIGIRPPVAKARIQREESAEGSAQTDNVSTADFQSLSQDLGRALESEAHSDAQLVCEDTTFKVHKFLGSARSDTLKEAFKDTNQLDFTDVFTEDLLRLLVNYLYTGILPDTLADDPLTILSAAQVLGCNSLKSACFRQMTKRNCLEFMKMVNNRNEEAKEAVIQFICDQNDILMSDEWDALTKECPELTNEIYGIVFKRKWFSSKG